MYVKNQLTCEKIGHGRIISVIFTWDRRLFNRPYISGETGLLLIVSTLTRPQEAYCGVGTVGRAESQSRWISNLSLIRTLFSYSARYYTYGKCCNRTVQFCTSFKTIWNFIGRASRRGFLEPSQYNYWPRGCPDGLKLSLSANDPYMKARLKYGKIRGRNLTERWTTPQ